MVETTIDEKVGAATIVLRPNNSASWQTNLILVGVVAFILLCVSIYFALKSLWLIFPFAGLEIVVLLVSIYLRVRSNNSTEVITFDKTTVLVERGCHFAEKRWKYQRAWAKIFVKNPAFYGHPKKIFIRSHGKELELGSFLNNQDKEILIKDLKNIVYA